MKKTFLLFTLIMYCFMGTGFCADKVVVIPLFSDEKCTGDAISEDVLSGKTFSNSTGKGITGTMPNIAPQDITPSTTEQPITQGYHNGTGNVLGDSDLASGNIKYGVTIFGVTGTYHNGKCGAYITPGVWKEFDCYNLSAIGKTTDDDPFTPSWRLIGGYWQWGRKGPDSPQWYDTNTTNFAHGPTGPDTGDANDGVIAGWDTTEAPDGSWSDASKIIANDPCPAGYRVPTKNQWDGVWTNNTQSVTGSWSNSATNYSSARSFGDDLMLPAAGYRNYSSGALGSRGYYGCYWSSTQSSSNNAWYLDAGSSSADTYDNYRRYGFSVRCVAE